MTDTTTREALEFALTNWASQRRIADRARDALVLQAIAAGIPKYRVFTLTGIARTTIDRIVKKAGSQ